MKDFAAIDFETANFERCSVCSVGVVVVRGGELVDSFYSLIQPEPNYYTYRCTAVHGLTCCDTDDAPVFSEVWKQVAPHIQGLPLVAHNSSFDEGCLRVSVLRHAQSCSTSLSQSAQSSASHCGTRLWLRAKEPPPCIG